MKFISLLIFISFFLNALLIERLIKLRKKLTKCLIMILALLSLENELCLLFLIILNILFLHSIFLFLILINFCLFFELIFIFTSLFVLDLDKSCSFLSLFSIGFPRNWIEWIFFPILSVITIELFSFLMLDIDIIYFATYFLLLYNMIWFNNNI